MAVVLTRPQALADLVEAWVYVAEDSVAAADRFANLMIASFDGWPGDRTWVTPDLNWRTTSAAFLPVVM